MTEKLTNEQRGKQALRDLEKELNARDRKDKSRPWAVAAASVAVIAAVGGGIFFLANQNGDGEDVTASGESTTEETSTDTPAEAEPLSLSRATALPASVNCTYDVQDEQSEHFVGVPPTDDVSATGTVNVTLDTSAGPIGMELDRSVSPCTVNAIEYLATEGYFDGTVCHRLTTGEGLKVLQCGDPTGTGSGGPGFQFANEYPTDEVAENVDTSQIPSGLPGDQVEQYKQMLLQQEPPVTYPRGTIAMANAGAGTNGSQFFLNYRDSTLPPLYTYFGKIDDTGLETLDAIAQSGVEGDQPDGAPKEEVTITSAAVG
ncbi:peptidyl-prolyl cis-trans isomerase B (cyclophilin B) [Corynebacterium mycetoides]|uniref:Peptidyl-prolyl cis-trans isomerase B (Cyclophilin B) n=1 Tax=Corynebacterium mycetoides TaxID=38302 RepID=A0A1G9MNM8_9CORY|nr:peptidylprolyl isomerase [Corynebacterium mycetoides]SDL75724.1 peptidyl-prolyl cis-trans isomerase B (cyclophilin B) [Corynebacterium mycetoides]